MSKTYSDEMQIALEECHNRGYFNGASLKQHIDEITKIIEMDNIKTILDYGCGKAEYHPTEWNATKYDPGYFPYQTKPTGNFDLVICTDVMEHIEEQYVDAVFSEIFKYANKSVYLSISTEPAKKNLPDGRNCHVTQKDSEWWIERIFKAKPTAIYLYIHFN